jgi:uncharacterized lipoprotein NlpE involved in copper resistance
MIVARRLVCAAVGAAVCLSMGCMSELATVAPAPPEHAVDVGPAHGSSCGLLFLDLVPVGVNDRAVRAYAEALRTARAEAITGTTIEDSWYFVVVGTLLCTDVDGRAVRAAP